MSERFKKNWPETKKVLKDYLKDFWFIFSIVFGLILIIIFELPLYFLIFFGIVFGLYLIYELIYNLVKAFQWALQLNRWPNLNEWVTIFCYTALIAWILFPLMRFI